PVQHCQRGSGLSVSRRCLRAEPAWSQGRQSLQQAPYNAPDAPRVRQRRCRALPTPRSCGCTGPGSGTGETIDLLPLPAETSCPSTTPVAVPSRRAWSVAGHSTEFWHGHGVSSAHARAARAQTSIHWQPRGILRDGRQTARGAVGGAGKRNAESATRVAVSRT
ncbi:conserved hypothetical protein, partial [Ricinus communis]